MDDDYSFFSNDKCIDNSSSNHHPHCIQHRTRTLEPPDVGSIPTGVSTARGESAHALLNAIAIWRGIRSRFRASTNFCYPTSRSSNMDAEIWCECSRNLGSKATAGTTFAMVSPDDLLGISEESWVATGSRSYPKATSVRTT